MSESKVELSREELSQVLDFAQGIYNVGRIGTYSPFMSNELLNDLNNNAKMPTAKDIEKALSDYKNNAENLQTYNEFFSKFDMLFQRTILLYVNALSFDMMVSCKNAYTQADYESSEYQEDKRRFYNFLEKFNYKSEFRKVLQQVIEKEVFYTWFRKTKWGNKGMKCALQILPQQYCMLTGYWENGLLFDFNMGYFLMAGVDIDGYDPVFKKYYNKVFNNYNGIDNYIPSATLDNRTGDYAAWTQTSPDDGAWCFKFRTDNFNVTPFLSALMKESINNIEVEALQKDKDIISAYGLLVGEIRLMDDLKSGDKVNQFAIDPKTLGNFMGMIKQGLHNNLRAVAMPTENTKFFQYEDKTPDMYSTQLSASAGVGSSVGRIIYSSDKMSNAEIEAGLTEVYNIVRPMYRQFENFLNFYGNKLTKRYKFTVHMDGSNYRFERRQRFDDLMKLSDRGINLGATAFASVYGIEPYVFERMMDEAKWGGFGDKLMLLMNNNTMNTGGDDSGRPKQKEVAESTESNRNQSEIK